MNRFTTFMENKDFSDDVQKRKINVIKRLNNVFTNKSENYDNFDFLIDEKEGIRKWLIENLSHQLVVITP